MYNTKDAYFFAYFSFYFFLICLCALHALQVLVFIIGGATYQEEREMMELSQSSGVCIHLGGTTILNSKIFLADLSQLVFQANR